MPEKDIYIAGIGSSAGGLEALTAFVQNIRSCERTAFIVVQHLGRYHPSRLTEILARKTDVPVKEIVNDMEIRPGTVFVMPSGCKLRISEGRLYLERRPDEEKINRAINHFFVSLAEDQKEKAFGVILSGTGTDGVEGVKAIERLGGVVIVQDPKTARFDGMPENTIHMDHPDFVTSPEKMPDLIQELQDKGKQGMSSLRQYD